MDALKVTGVGTWWVCMHPSGLGRWKQCILIHPHIAQVVPAHDLIKEQEPGAGDFHVSWEVEVGMSLGLSSAQASLKCHLSIYINSSMQACVYMVCF